jgi:hypothetical protein
LKTYVCAAVFAVTLAGAAAPAAAQATQQPAPTPETRWFAGVNTGGAGAEKFGPVFGGEVGYRLWKNLDVMVEGVWFGNLVTERQLDSAATIADFIGSTQGGSTSSEVDVPTNYFGVGLRWVFEQNARFKPYAIFQLGGARLDKQPTFTLNGADITDTLPNFGVTLGEDLIGQSREAAVGGGFGMVVPFRESWYFDAGLRFLSIGGDDRTNVTRLVLGGGYRF